MRSSRILRNQPIRVITRYITTSVHTHQLSEHHLKKIFDDQKYFLNFNKSSTENSHRTGLFKNEYLTSPNGLVEFSKTSLTQAKELVDEMLQSVDSKQGELNYIKKLDQLSDILCRVIDVAEFIRFVHPSSKWTSSAQKTHEIMFEYMNQLNTNVDLYKNLKNILSDGNIVAKLSNEEVKVGEYLKQDFERSGIHMDPETRANFVSITQEISLLGSYFNNEINQLKEYQCEVTKEEFESISQDIRKEIKSYQNRLSPSKHYIPMVSNVPYSVLLNCTNESLRKKIWIALHDSPEEQIKILNKFITYRGILSKMLGYKSYSHYQLEHKMAKNPENVITFLNNLQTSLKNKGVIEEMQKLIKYKTNEPLNNDEIMENLKPWDRDYLLTKLQENRSNDVENDQEISEYFSIGTVMSGLNKLFSTLYNVSFVPVATQTGETWDCSQVRKIKVMDDSRNQILGFIYLDFWSPKVLPSHFTIICSRRLNTLIGESVESMKKVVQLDSDYQLPIISLICNFDNSSKKRSLIGRLSNNDEVKPTLLSLDQVDTIFHEMGHALHSMIGRTELHNLSGTRCSTDFVELPSVLMESFSKDSRVLSEIGRHHSTNEPIPTQLIENYNQSRNSLEACETFMQSKMAILDQFLHNEQIIDLISENKMDQIDSTKIYHQIESGLKVFADKWSTWHGKFPHLFSYGAVYYSYLLDRAIAEKIYSHLFKENPWNSKNGMKYKDSILVWGGTKDPWECLADCLDNAELSKGDSKAMEIIGKNSNL